MTVMAWLLDSRCGANVVLLVCRCQGSTALLSAATHNNLAMVKAIFEAGANVNATKNDVGLYPCSSTRDILSSKTEFSCHVGVLDILTSKFRFYSRVTLLCIMLAQPGILTLRSCW
jgi:ankyrin repeat protein